ncbi:Putative methyltransferase, putative [Leishmania donovani]|uniref:protein-histidine N-methyltransferase n=1 Tax=Leishmania donovani TaxID=5661 RepID=A0A3S7WTG3_LEIDO|nr:Putative methyltransferase, putative [Leishmania donovani]
MRQPEPHKCITSTADFFFAPPPPHCCCCFPSPPPFPHTLQRACWHFRCSSRFTDLRTHASPPLLLVFVRAARFTRPSTPSCLKPSPLFFFFVGSTQPVEVRMDSSAGGFFFPFGSPSTTDRCPGATTVDAADSTSSTLGTAVPSPPIWPPAKISTATFPWVSLDSDTLHEWAAGCCCVAPSNNVKCNLSTKPLQLKLRAVSPASAEGAPGEASSSADAKRSDIFTLCYQTSPEVDTLTSVAATQTPEMTPSSSAKRERRDVVPGRYYGGLKVWSCAVLLAEYLANHAAQYRSLFEAAVVVAELGCGQGLPGLAAMCLGARRVVFQDYNEEVLNVCTKPNVAATVCANESLQLSQGGVGTTPLLHVKFVHGDWVDLSWESQGAASSSAGLEAFCDVILGSDVTFDKDACDRLACVLHRWLRPYTGTAIIVSKDYYFGTNGGYLEFTESAEPYGLRVELLKRVDTADKMPHVVLRVTHAA